GAGERADLLKLVGLPESAGPRVGKMSKGMQQRLGIAQALVGSPSLLLLDEPTSALDPAGRKVVRRVLAEVRDRGVSVLLSSHLLSEVELVCDHVAILVKGDVVERGTTADLQKPRGIQVETGSGIRMIEGAGRDDVPRIVRELVESGESVYGIQVLSSTLEDAYLEAVGEGAT
ncbi:MAG TPA: ATP-binding cassette domain-containing protein, partial [Solirubrobacterales bacterium]|nr:ATP-binding cassette domain-containing protein [Solirubrobacterales bacterium]